MYLSNLIIRNFRNFKAVEIPLSGNIVLLGENRVGKSNLLFAMRLVLDQGLPDSVRQLKLSDFWDGCNLNESPQIEVHVDFADFDSDPNLTALLTDYRRPSNHEVARLSYIYRKRSDVADSPKTNEDYEFIIFGGEDESRNVHYSVRRRISLDMLDALRDAEAQLASWRNSPLRPLIDDATSSISQEQLDTVAADLQAANTKIENFPSIQSLETKLRDGILDLAGSSQDINARLRFTPNDPLRLFRSIGLFIDDGKRSLNEASLGSANVTLIALKLAEFSWRRTKNERNYSLLCIEEPEAHLHPQLQRTVFNKILKQKLEGQALIFSSHSPTLAAIAPLHSIVMLRMYEQQTMLHSLAELPISPQEMNDLEHYITATRSEIFFSRGIIFVEGDAEEALLPTFSEAIGYNLDALGITVCNISGVNFKPYVKLAAGLGIPFAVITDWDPLDGSKPPLGKKRTIDIWNSVCEVSKSTNCLDKTGLEWCDQNNFPAFHNAWKDRGIFLNENTFEVAISQEKELLYVLLDILDDQDFGPIRTQRIEKWRQGEPVDPSQLLSMIKEVGKGRLSYSLKPKISGLTPPQYIIDAIKYMVHHVKQ